MEISYVTIIIFLEMAGEHPEWLPMDWKVCVRIRSSGKKDKSDVLQYLKKASEVLTLKELNKYYVDPISGRHFCNMQTIFRYLETKDSGISVFKENNEDRTSEEPGDQSKSVGGPRMFYSISFYQSTIGAKGEGSSDKKVNNIFNGSGSVKPSDVPEAKYVEQREVEADSMAVDLPNKLPQVGGKWRHEGVLRRNKRLANSKLKNNVTDDRLLQSGSESAAVKNTDLPEMNALQHQVNKEVSVAKDRQHEKVTHENKRKKPNSN